MIMNNVPEGCGPFLPFHFTPALPVEGFSVGFFKSKLILFHLPL
jgi:hypothetical protein